MASHPQTGVRSMETEKREYEAPAVKVLGTLHSLTEMPIDKTYGPTDGYTFMGQGITNASP